MACCAAATRQKRALQRVSAKAIAVDEGIANVHGPPQYARSSPAIRPPKKEPAGV